MDVPRILSKPHRVHWAGFTTTTARLQQAGWSLSAEQDFQNDGIRLALRNEDAQLYGITDRISFYRLAVDDYERSMARYREPRYSRDFGSPLASSDDGLLDFHVVRMASQIMVHHLERTNPLELFNSIDAATQITREKISRLEDLVPFAAPLVQTKELIVDESEVSAILAKLIDAQKPEQERIRDRQRLRESREGLELGADPRRRFHAQILSIAA